MRTMSPWTCAARAQAAAHGDALARRQHEVRVAQDPGLAFAIAKAHVAQLEARCQVAEVVDRDMGVGAAGLRMIALERREGDVGEPLGMQAQHAQVDAVVAVHDHAGAEPEHQQVLEADRDLRQQQQREAEHEHGEEIAVAGGEHLVDHDLVEERRSEREQLEDSGRRWSGATPRPVSACARRARCAGQGRHRSHEREARIAADPDRAERLAALRLKHLVAKETRHGSPRRSAGANLRAARLHRPKDERRHSPRLRRPRRAQRAG